jgi:Protein of unknown function (DUF3365)
MLRWGIGALALSAAAGCARAPVAITVDRVEAQAKRADAAIAELRGTLLTRLTSAVAEGGPPLAISVCSTEAAGLAQKVAASHGVAVGRTSFRLRNGGNAPPAWAAATVEAARGLPASKVAPAYFDLGDRIGVLQPIPTGALCLTCHGAPGALDPKVAAEIASRYPEDRAVDFAEGDLRGFFWVEVPSR